MNKLSTLLTFLALASYACTGAHAQARKMRPPVDTSVIEILTVPLETPAPSALPSPEKVFGNPYLQPQYPGGTRAMYEFIKSNLRMPRAAKRAGVSGRVFVSFVIDTTGKIGDVSVLKGIGFGCDEEAVRLVEAMPNWKPGEVHRKPMRVKYNLPISFNAE